MCRLWIFFTTPHILMLVFYSMAVEKFDEDAPGYKVAWRSVFIPLILFGLTTALQMYMVKPCFGMFVLRATQPFFYFLVLLSVYLDRVIPHVPGKYVGPCHDNADGTAPEPKDCGLIPIYPFFIPLYFMMRHVYVFYRDLPYNWDAQF